MKCFPTCEVALTRLLNLKFRRKHANTKYNDLYGVKAHDILLR